MPESQSPSVGRIVHYVARGSADGRFPAVCRAAIITEVSRYVPPDRYVVSLCVLNPNGMFFDHDVAYSAESAPGTWHWPERE